MDPWERSMKRARSSYPSDILAFKYHQMLLLPIWRLLTQKYFLGSFHAWKRLSLGTSNGSWLITVQTTIAGPVTLQRLFLLFSRQVGRLWNTFENFSSTSVCRQRIYRTAKYGQWCCGWLAESGACFSEWPLHNPVLPVLSPTSDSSLSFHSRLLSRSWKNGPLRRQDMISTCETK